MYVTIFVYFTVLTVAQCLSPEQHAKLTAIFIECSQTTGINEDQARAAVEAETTDDPKVKEHVLCFSKKIGFQNEAGDIQLDVMRQKIGEAVPDAAMVEEMISKCAVQKATPEDTAFDTSVCLYKMKPV
nr:odorant binding protein [Semanotus bifasciatus]